jgi:UDP:flavonoid glycosyltransferase YjiC (YdhE family)
MITEKYAKKFIVFVRQVAQATQHRLVIAGVADAHGEIEKGYFAVGHVPHSLLFPQMSAVVHHGGAGTTATAARVGVPQITVPHFFDQFYWGHQIFVLGLGPSPINRRVLTVPRLSNAIQECLTNPSFQRQATFIAYHLREQDPLGNAVAYIESIGRDTRFSNSTRSLLH